VNGKTIIHLSPEEFPRVPLVMDGIATRFIRENKIAQIPSMIQTSKGIGMQTMEAACNELIAKNLVTRDEVSFYLSSSMR